MGKIKGTAKLLEDVRNRSEIEAATGAVFTVTPSKPGLVRSNYDGFLLFMKAIFQVFGDDGFVSHGAMITTHQLLKIRTVLSLMRMDAIRCRGLDAALSIEEFARLLVGASDGQTRAIAVVLDDPENRKDSTGVEQEFFKHIKDYELDIAVGGLLFDDHFFEESVAYKKARKRIARYGYPRRQNLRKIFGKLACDNAAETLGLSADELNELRKLFRQWILELGLTPEQYAVAFSGISSAQDYDIEVYRRDYARHFKSGPPSNPHKIGRRRFSLKSCVSGVDDFGTESILVDRVTSKHLDKFLASGWIVQGDSFKWSLGIQGGRNIPVRIRLKDFSLSKHQRRVLKKNVHTNTEVHSLSITEAECALFANYRVRLIGAATDSLFDAVPETSSNEIKTLTVSDGDRLLAASYLVIGKTATYSTFAMHDLTMDRNSLGILTILKEIEYSILQGKDYYYLGYVHDEPSYYDYKKRFNALESFDGKGNWTSCARLRGSD